MHRQEERRRGLTLHPSLDRRYEHADLTSHRHKNRRRRRLTFLAEKSVQAMVAHYARELEAEPAEFEAFAAEVGRRLRLELQPEWTLDLAETRALALAEALFVELEVESETPRPEDDPDEPGRAPGTGST
ncbi:MAG TPA: hypothetical protein VFE28_08925 [Candidatus Krumholzibacteria bacterium]|nr:hypothetical protein [Candidatus Krumholzibacteria bacterium]